MFACLVHVFEIESNKNPLRILVRVGLSCFVTNLVTELKRYTLVYMLCNE